MLIATPHYDYSAMFCQRTIPSYRKLRELIQRSELGKIQRITGLSLIGIVPNITTALVAGGQLKAAKAVAPHSL
ncbi:hypothetical protein QEH59_08730 [Coraliomargarita sp. SDUM461004]|uniref:Uncharacterized protein n=1 Tax=Thalassobacterium sedimentorum TaxID=3041258 RepID=A0ABU1AI68_9BACT|nr:hypothetical protein [Coraliomargarita sp. SDUM461004]MDQ8194510.1 hypothetical protein [Coraliomargarita sp. SDUM461004]